MQGGQSRRDLTLMRHGLSLLAAGGRVDIVDHGIGVVRKDGRQLFAVEDDNGDL